MDNTPNEAPAAAPAAESVWVKVPLTDGKYAVSSDGRVARVLLDGKRRILKPYKNNTPYLSIKIVVNGKICNRYVHRLVAENFLGDGCGKQVNHINGDKTDNRASNLEWVTASENNLHRTRILGRGLNGFMPKPICCSDGYIFKSIKEAALSLGVSTTTVRRNLDGFTKTVAGVKLTRKEI